MTNTIEKSVALKAPQSRVWRALTDHREFGAWFGVAFEAPFAAGHTARGRKLNPCYAHLTFEAGIQKMGPEHYFSVTWGPYAVDPAIGHSNGAPTLVDFRLEKIAGGPRLTVVESGFDHVPAHRRAEALRMNTKGWEIQMDNIAQYLDGRGAEQVSDVR